MSSQANPIHILEAITQDRKGNVSVSEHRWRRMVGKTTQQTADYFARYLGVSNYVWYRE